MDSQKEHDFKIELKALLSRFSAEDGSDTEAFILASFLSDCLKAGDSLINLRAQSEAAGDIMGFEKISIPLRPPESSIGGFTIKVSIDHMEINGNVPRAIASYFHGAKPDYKAELVRNLFDYCPEVVGLDMLTTLIDGQKHKGRPGCTYNDTQFDSQSAAYGFNLAIDTVISIIKKHFWR